MATIETMVGGGFDAWNVEASGYATGTGTVAPGYRSAYVGTVGPNNFMVLYSSIENIAYNAAIPAFDGTMDTAVIYNSTGTSLINFTDFSLSLYGLFPDTSNQTINWESFWETMLAGATTFNLTQSSANYLMGDYAIVNTGQIQVGGVDTFNGLLNSAEGYLSGDALVVVAGATLTGGNDIFNYAAVANLGGATNLMLVGDVGGNSLTSNGAINGGNDSFTVNATSTINAQLTGGVTVVGDVDTLGAASILNGGNDLISLTNVASSGVVGDFIEAITSAIIGGNDTINFIRTPGTAGYATSTFTEISGEGSEQNSGSLTGGLDTINITNASGGYVNGEVRTIANANFTGADDTITVKNTLPIPTTTGPSLPVPQIGYISGDAYSAAGSGSFRGGNDTINVANTLIFGAIVGDAYEANANGGFVGGNDTITDNYNYPASGGTVTISGDAYTSSDPSFTGGNDTIVFNGNLGTGGQFEVSGDLITYATGLELYGVFVGGNDTISVNNSDASVSAFLYGDMASADLFLLSFTGGNDTLKGGAGNDVIYGDALPSVAASYYEGGNDTLDGRGGNDLIDGGLGNDTASFASLAQAVLVDLQGIVGPGVDLYEAVGQGSDQLVGIENVTGSIMNDVIRGDAGVNIINGGAGNDTMTGRGGADSYYVDSLLDKVIEGVGGGSDRIYTYGSYTLAVGQEVEIISTANNAGTTAINITGNEFNNSIAGNAGINTINGGGGNDTLYGYAGADTLIGGVGNGLDNLFGGNGNDILTGGGGADSFSFNFALNATTNRDTITDFVVVDDTIKLDRLVFATLGVGALNPNAFWSSATGVAHDADDRIVYNTTTGVLTYDSNGNVAGGDIAFATLTGAPAGLTSLDFVVI